MGQLPPSIIRAHPPFQVEVWCQDCCGEDFYGCFEGGSEKAEETFSSIEAAIAHGQGISLQQHPWKFRVVDAEGLDIRSECRESGLLHPWDDKELYI